jgi:prefoldin subunit 5
MDPNHVAAGDPTGGQFAPASSSSSSTQKKPASKPAAKKPATKPATKKPATKKPAAKKPAAKKPSGKKKPSSSSDLRAQAANDYAQAMQLSQQAAAIRQQISALKKKLSNLNQLTNSGNSAGSTASSGSSGTSSSGTTSSGAASSGTSSGSSGTSSGSSTSSSSASNTAAANQIRSQISTLTGQANQLDAQATQLRQQAAQLSSQAKKTAESNLNKIVPEGEDVTEVLEKAATLTGSGELTYFSFPIEKAEPNEDGDLVVYGKATDGSLDSDEQIVDPDFSAKAVQEWLSSGGNVRVQHNPQRDPAGIGIEAETGSDGSQWVKSLVIEPVAKRLVQKGALRAYSVGIARPVIVRDGSARGGRITGGQIVEISLVDRPANKNCGIQLVKAASDGTPEWVGKIFGADDEIAKAASDGDGDIWLNLPGDVNLSISPMDVAKIVNRNAVRKSISLAKRDTADGKIVDSGGRDVSDVPDEDFAGPGHTFPIKTKDDVSDAASLAHHADDPDAVRSKIKSIARRKFGMQDEELPPSLNGGDSSEKGAKMPCPKCSKPASGLFCKSCGAKLPAAKIDDASIGKDDDGDGDSDEPQGRTCSLCKGSGKIREGHVTCPKCKGDGKMSPADQADAEKAERKAQRKAEEAAVREALLGDLLKGKQDDDDDDDSSSSDDDDDSDDDDSDDDDGGMDEGLHASKGKKSKSGKNDDDDDDDDDDSDDDSRSNSSNDDDDDNDEDVDDSPEDSDDDEDDDDSGSSKSVSLKRAAKKPKKPKKPKETSMPPAMKGGKPVPGRGVTGENGIQAVPAHREPDGQYIESFEHDAGLPTVPDDQLELKTAKWQRAIGAGSGWGALHDLTCPAYHPATAAKCHPGAQLSGVDIAEWQREAMSKAAGAPLAEALVAHSLWQAAVTLKTEDPSLLWDIRLEAHKAFQDANPGPGKGLTPVSITPGQFKRPYLSDGHAAPSPGQSGPNTATVPNGQPSASQYQRGYISDGHAAQSPSNGGGGGGSMPAPLAPVSGVSIVADASKTSIPGELSSRARAYYTNSQRDTAKQAMQVMHDHIAQTFPDLCPMTQTSSAPANDIPAVKAAAVTETEARPVRKASRSELLQLAEKLEKQVLKGSLSLEEAKQRLELAAQPVTPAPVRKAAVTAPQTVSPDVIKSAVEEATSGLARELRQLKKMLSKLNGDVSKLGDSADPNVRAFKGVAMTAPPPQQQALPPAAFTTSDGPAGYPTMTQAAEHAQVMMVRELEDQARNNPDSAAREAAWAAIYKMRGLVR